MKFSLVRNMQEKIKVREKRSKITLPAGYLKQLRFKSLRLERLVKNKDAKTKT